MNQKMGNLSRRAGVVFKVGVVVAFVYIFSEMVRLPPDLKRQLSRLSPLAQQIGGICHNDGDGDWIQGFLKRNGEGAISSALSELILSETEVSSCAMSHARTLRIVGVRPSLEAIAAKSGNPNSAFAKQILEEFGKQERPNLGLNGRRP